MKKLNTKGFGAIEVLLIFVIVGIIGGAGYMVYNSQKKTNQSLDNANNSLAQATKIKEQTSANTIYTNNDLGFQFEYPKDWGEVVASKDLPKSEYSTIDYTSLTFSKNQNVGINFVTGAYSSPLDACGYDDPVKNAEHGLNAHRASVVGWEEDSIKSYKVGQDGRGPSVRTTSFSDARLVKVTSSDKTLQYSENRTPIVAGANNGCASISQNQADEANAYSKFFFFTTNYSNEKVKGVNAQFDARKNDDDTARTQLVKVLDTIKEN